MKGMGGVKTCQSASKPELHIKIRKFERSRKTRSLWPGVRSLGKTTHSRSQANQYPLVSFVISPGVEAPIGFRAMTRTREGPLDPTGRPSSTSP